MESRIGGAEGTGILGYVARIGDDHFVGWTPLAGQRRQRPVQAHRAVPRWDHHRYGDAGHRRFPSFRLLDYTRSRRYFSMRREPDVRSLQRREAIRAQGLSASAMSMRSATLR